MAQNDTPVKALVLAGGGARGSYQVGVWRALTELGWRPQIITGTSVGSLNGAMFALDLYETARDMWMSIRSQDVMELPEENADLSELHAFLREVVRDGGMDVTPLEEIVERVLDEDALRASPIRFGLVTVEKRGLKPRELTLEDIPAGKVKDYLLASAADTWINVGPCNTLAELTAQNPKFADVPAVRNRQVFNNNRRQPPAGGSDFWESGVIRPDLVLHDLCAVFNPQAADTAELYYYKRLE